MKINTADFFVNNKIISVSEDGPLYDLPRDSAEENWDKLAAYYSRYSREQDATQGKLDEFYRSISLSRVENETATECLGLVRRSVLKMCESIEAHEEQVNIKGVIRSALVDILEKKTEELKSNIQKEDEVYEVIRNLKQEVKILGKSLQIFTSPFNSVDFKVFQERKKTEDGLVCTVKFKDRVYKGFFNPNAEDSQVYIDYSRSECRYAIENIEIVIEKGSVEDRNEICTAIIKEYIKGRMLDVIALHIPFLVSRFCVRQLIAKNESGNRKIVEIGDVKMLDGLSSTFYVVSSSGVVKVLRCCGDFEIYMNGKPVDINTL